MRSHSYVCPRSCVDARVGQRLIAPARLWLRDPAVPAGAGGAVAVPAGAGGADGAVAVPAGAGGADGAVAVPAGAP